MVNGRRILRSFFLAAALLGGLTPAVGRAADGSMPPVPPVSPSHMAHAAGTVAPFVDVVPNSGPIAVGGAALPVALTFHNTTTGNLDQDFFVAVAFRLAPPAPALTTQELTVEWKDGTTWRPVDLFDAGGGALAGYLTTDGGLPSVGSIPAGQSAEVDVRFTLSAKTPLGKLQFIGSGYVQPDPAVDPVDLMDGTATYAVVASLPTPTPPAPSSTHSSTPATATTTPTHTTTPVRTTTSTRPTKAPSPTTTTHRASGLPLASTGAGPVLGLAVTAAGLLLLGALFVSRRRSDTPSRRH
jgi:hypothetical protein